MTEVEFHDLVSRLNTYFGLEKTVSPSRFEEWCQKIKDVPSAAIGFIYDKITANSETLPRNLPKHIWAYLYQWRESPDRVSNRSSSHCVECGGHGLIWVRRPTMVEGDQMQGHYGLLHEEVSYRCIKCDNWSRHCHYKAKPAASKAELIESGYEILQ